MDRKRVRDEVIEILAAKLLKLPPLNSDPEFDYDNCALRPDITDNHLDIHEVSMDLEDAFAVYFEDALPGDPAMATINQVVEYIWTKMQAQVSGSPALASKK